VDLLQIIVLGIVQGLTEFLPISSAAHLILVPKLVGWPDQGLSFDIAVHIGTLAAVVFYFRRELAGMGVDWWLSVSARRHTHNSRLAWYVLFGTLPVGIFGLLGKSAVETYLRSPLVIAVTTIVFGLLLWVAWRLGSKRRDEHQINIWDALLIGCAQAIALIPGTSRSGITITAGLLRGLAPETAARFSFLLSVPVTALAGMLLIVEVIESGNALVWRDMFVGAVLSGVSAYLCIHYFLKLINRIGMLPFVVYRLLLGSFLIYLFA
jgi:undecaprenyl-diphosphatase